MLIYRKVDIKIFTCIYKDSSIPTDEAVREFWITYGICPGRAGAEVPRGRAVKNVLYSPESAEGADEASPADLEGLNFSATVP